VEILPQLIVNALITGSIYALASSGLAITYGLLKILNFAHGHLMMVGAYIFYLASVQIGLSLPLSAFFTIIVGGGLAAVSLLFFVEPFLKYSFFLVFVTTLALSTILESAISMIFGVNVKSLSQGYDTQSIEFWGIYITPIQIGIIVSAILILGILGFIIHFTSVGRRIRSLSEHPYGAQAIGVNRKKVNLFCFIIATLLACYAGIMVGFETNIQPTMGNSFTIKAFAAMILGGLGNMWGTVAGAYILGFVENLSIGFEFGGYSIPAGYKDAFAFLIILLILLFKPKGLFLKESRSA